MAKLKIGSQIEDFTISSTGGDFKLSDFKGQKIVLYFYPKDSTPGCTLQGQEFSKLKSQFEELNTQVFGISRDSLKSHENFKSKQKYKIDLLSDTEEILCKKFDVIKEKNMYGKKVMGIERSTFLLDENHRLLQEWRKVKAEGNAKMILDFIKDL